MYSKQRHLHLINDATVEGNASVMNDANWRNLAFHGNGTVPAALVGSIESSSCACCRAVVGSVVGVTATGSGVVTGCVHVIMHLHCHFKFPCDVLS